MKKVYSILILIALPLIGFSQQTPSFDPYMTEQMMDNPAYTGLQGGSATALWRGQFNNESSAPEYYFVGFNTLMFHDQVGIGITLNYEKTNLITNTDVYLNAAYHLRTNESSYLSFGLSAEFFKPSLSIGNTYIRDPNDPLINSYDDEMKIDFSFGLSYKSTNWRAGASVQRIRSLISDEEILPPQVIGNVQYELPLRLERDIVEFRINNYFSPNNTNRVDFSTRYIYNNLGYIGAIYRSSSSLNFNLGGVFKDRYHFGYSYEVVLADELNDVIHSFGVRFLLNEQFFERKGKNRFEPIDSVNPNSKEN